MMEPRVLSHHEYQRTILGPMDAMVQDMEREGIPVSIGRFKELGSAASLAASEKEAELATWAHEVAGLSEMNFNSQKQVLALLDKAGVPRSPYFKKGMVPDDKASVDDGAIEWLLAHSPEHRPQLTLLREYRRAKRVVNYCEKWAGMAVDRGGYATLHPSFGFATDNDSRPGAVTGRFAVKNPALNQVPSRSDKDVFGVKSAFVAPPGEVVVSVDASQLEVVLIADFATRLLGTTAMADRLRAKVDFHVFTSKEIHGKILGDQIALDTPDKEYKKNPYTARLRDQAKNLRYGKHYRKSGKAFGETLFDEHGNAIGHEMGEKLSQGLYAADPELEYLHGYGDLWVKRYGTAVSAFGRWRMCPGWDSPKRGEFNRACRVFSNWYPQATGQELLVIALLNIRNDIRLQAMGYRARLPVHDEIVGTCPERHAAEATELVAWHISNAVALHAPLAAEGAYASNWKEAKK